VAPEDLARFDWRAALGPDVTLESAVTLAIGEVTTAQTTLPAPQPRTQVVARRNRNTEVDVRRGSARNTRKRTRRMSPLWRGLWATIAFALMALLVLGVYNTAARRGTAPSAQTAAELDSVAPVPALPPGNVEVAPPPQASASQAVERGVVTGAGDAVAARAKGAAPSQAVAHSIQGRPEKPAGSTVPLAAKQSAEQPSAPKVASKPRELCADATVFERTMCVYKECQKPEYAQIPQCVADRKHWEARNKQILP
jgi:hypothetical protein